jgi:hypothetical protein
MHDLDRTQAEYEGEYPIGLEFGEYESGEAEYGETESPFNETEQLEMAAELLEVSNEQELDHFLGDLISKAAGAVKDFAVSPAGQAVGGVLKSAAKQALPLAGAALGGYLGGPAGAKIGSQLASTAGSMFGLEVGEMSMEDREFEVAKRFVQFAGDTAQRAAQAPAYLPPAEQAKRSVIDAARKYAPGLVPAAMALNAANGNGHGHHHGHTGKWVRKGRHIILYGV